MKLFEGDFAHLVSGGIIFVFSENMGTGIVHGFNLSSPNLRMQNYLRKELSNQCVMPREISEALLEQYDTGDCKYHPGSITIKRLSMIVDKMNELFIADQIIDIAKAKFAEL